jgi:hypothetical protein
MSSCSYPVPNGTYDVTLRFSELSYSTIGKRKMNVRIENQLVLPNLDVFALAGKNAALDRTFSVTVTDGSLDITFTKVADNPMIAAIEIIPTGGAGVTPIPTISATPTASATATRTPTPTAPTSGTVTRTPTTRTPTGGPGLSVLASDDFECSTNWGCGTGWVESSWTPSGAASINTVGAHGGSRHALLTSSTGSATRSVNVTGHSSVHLQLWAKSYSFESGDKAVAQVSTDRTNFTMLRTWTNADTPNVYRFYDFDLLSVYPSASQLYIRLAANMSSADDFFYFDDVSILAN